MTLYLKVAIMIHGFSILFIYVKMFAIGLIVIKNTRLGDTNSGRDCSKHLRSEIFTFQPWVNQEFQQYEYCDIARGQSSYRGNP